MRQTLFSETRFPYLLENLLVFVSIVFELCVKASVNLVILLHEKFLQFDWLRAVVFQLNLKYLHVKITNPLRLVV